MKQLLKNQQQKSFTNAVKKTFAFVGILLMTGLYAFAGFNGAKERAMNNFQKVFNNASQVSWEQTGDFLQASCMLDGTVTHVFYNADGDYVCLTSEITYADLPELARTFIEKKYAGFKPVESIALTSKDAGSSYFCSLEKAGDKVILKISKDGFVEVFEA